MSDAPFETSQIGAQVRVTVRNIWISLAGGYPYADTFAAVVANLQASFTSIVAGQGQEVIGILETEARVRPLADVMTIPLPRLVSGLTVMAGASSRRQ